MSTKLETMKNYVSDSDEDSDTDAAEPIDFDQLPLLEPGPGEHKLQHTYCLWFKKGLLRRVHPTKVDDDYSKSLHIIGRCASVEQWWSLYSHLVRPTLLKPYRELHLFKDGIKPMWEDPGNANGGRWIIKIRRNKIDRAWETVCMAMLGEQFLVGPEICGIVLSTKFPEDQLCVWNRTATDRASTTRIRDTLRRILNLPPDTPMEYKVHCDSLNYISGSQRR